jgi:hypothetical protein
MKNKIMLIVLGLSLSACASEYYYEYGKKITVTKSYEQRAINNNNITYYTTQNGQKVGVTNEIIVQCEANIDCKTTLEKYNLQNISNLSDKLFLVKINNSENIFETSQQLYNNKDIKLAHPNFIKTKKRR